MNKSQKTAVKPAVQGDLDCLCGVYSVVNAMYWLYGGRIRRTALFRVLIRHLDGVTNIADCLTAGMESALMSGMLRFLKKDGYGRCRIRVHRPFLTRSGVNTRTLLSRCETWLRDPEQRHVILVGDQYHWSVVTRMDGDFLYFFDSSSYTRLQRSQWSVVEKPDMYQVDPRDVWFIARENDDDQ